MKQIFFLLSLLVCFNAYALPQGFSGITKPNNAPQGFNLNIKPNTIDGIKKSAKDGDHVLLQGSFSGESDGKGNYTFTDSDMNNIEISIPDTGLTLLTNTDYYIWGKVKKSLFDCSIELIYISDPQQ